MLSLRIGREDYPTKLDSGESGEKQDAPEGSYGSAFLSREGCHGVFSDYKLEGCQQEVLTESQYKVV